MALRRRAAGERTLYRALAGVAVESVRVGDAVAADAALAESAALESPAWPPPVRWRLAERRKTVAVLRHDADGRRLHDAAALALARRSVAEEPGLAAPR